MRTYMRVWKTAATTAYPPGEQTSRGTDGMQNPLSDNKSSLSVMLMGTENYCK